MTIPYNVIKENIKPLFDFIPYFEGEKNGLISWSGGEKEKDDVITMTYPEYGEGIIKFVEAVENSGIMMNDYLDFLEKTTGANNDENTVIKNADLDTLIAILTYYVRQERFCDGLWERAVKYKIFLNILYRAKELVEILKSERDINSIDIKHENWGIISADEISKSHLNIDRNGKIEVRFYKGIYDNTSEIYEYKVSNSEINEFFTKLITDVKVLEWDDDYSVPVCDGYHWDVIIKSSDKSIKKISGTVEPPINGKVLEKMIYKLAKYEKKPWLF